MLALIRTWWAAITRSSRVHQEVEAELQFHIDAYAADLMARGVPEEEARRRARVELGRVDTRGRRVAQESPLADLEELAEGYDAVVAPRE